MAHFNGDFTVSESIAQKAQEIYNYAKEEYRVAVALHSKTESEYFQMRLRKAQLWSLLQRAEKTLEAAKEIVATENGE